MDVLKKSRYRHMLAETELHDIFIIRKQKKILFLLDYMVLYN